MEDCSKVKGGGSVWVDCGWEFGSSIWVG